MFLLFVCFLFVYLFVCLFCFLYMCVCFIVCLFVYFVFSLDGQYCYLPDSCLSKIFKTSNSVVGHVTCNDLTPHYENMPI